MQRAEDRLVDVELVEDDDAIDAGIDGGHGGGHGAGGPRSRGDGPGRSLRADVRRVPREVVLTAVAALVLGGAGVAVAQEGAERARDARLAEVPGLVASLAAPLREDWRAPGGDVVAVLDDLVVHWDSGMRGVVGTDTRDGAPRYTAPGECRLTPVEGDLRARFAGGGSAVRAQLGDVLLCVEGGGFGLLDGGPATARVVDLGTGEVRHTIAMAAGGSWQVVDGDLVSIGLDADDRVVAGRWSLVTGEQRWSHHGTDPVAVDESAGWGTTMSDGTVGLEVGSWSVDLDLETGSEVGTEIGSGTGDLSGGGATGSVQRVELVDGRVLEYSASPSGSVQTTVHPAGDEEPATVPGLVLPLVVDDGSVPGAVVAIDLRASGTGELGVVDLASGEWRWTSVVDGAGVAVVSGSVLVSDGLRTTALDARTGEQRWRSTSGPSTSFSGWTVVTDGRRVLTLEGDGLSRELVARDARTGERVWAIEPPVADGALVPLPDGTVLMVGRQQVVALRP